MQLLIVAATEMEIAAFKATNPSADFLITGVGAPHCMYRLTKKISEGSYDYIIQAGIAGSFGDLAMAETLIVKKDCFADLGIYESKTLKNFFDTGFLQLDEVPYKGGWLVNETALIDRLGFKTCTAVTVNTVSENVEMEKHYKELYQPQIESMEGAAFHYVCLMEKIPFIQLRSISNIVGIRDKSQWKIKESVASLNRDLLQIIELLKQNG